MAVGFDAYADRLYSTSSLPSVNTYTVAGWFKIDTTSDDGALLALEDTVGGGVHSIEVTTGNVAFYDNFGTRIVVRTLSTGSWYYVALTIGSLYEQTLHIMALGESSFVTGSDTAISIDNPWTYMGVCGRDIFGSGITGASAYVRSWSRVLSEAELLTESNSVSPVSTTNIVGAWPLDTAGTRLVSTNGSYLSEPDAGAWTTVASPTLTSPAGVEFTGSITSSTSLSADVSTSIEMMASSNAASSVDGSLSTDIFLLGHATSSTSLSADILTDITMGGSSDSASSTISSLSTEIVLEGSSQSTTSVAGDVDTNVLLVASVSSSTSLSADVSTSIEMIGSIQASSSASGSIVFFASLDGELVSSTVLSADLLTEIVLFAGIDSSTILTADLYTGTIQLSGDIVSSTSAIGTLVKPPRGVPDSSLFSKYLKNMTPTMGSKPGTTSLTSLSSTRANVSVSSLSTSRTLSPPSSGKVTPSTRPSAPRVFSSKKES